MSNEIEVSQPPEHIKALYLAAADYVMAEGGLVERITASYVTHRKGTDATVFYLSIECHGKAPEKPQDDEPHANN